MGLTNPSAAHGEHRVPPQQLATHNLARHQRRLPLHHPTWVQVEPPLAEYRRHANARLEVHLRDVVDSVLQRPVRAHVVDDSPRRNHDAIATLLDSLHAPVQRMIVEHDAVSLDVKRPPHSTQIRCALNDRFVALREHKRRHLAVPTALWRVRDRDPRCLHGANRTITTPSRITPIPLARRSVASCVSFPNAPIWSYTADPSSVPAVAAPLRTTITSYQSGLGGSCAGRTKSATMYKRPDPICPAATTTFVSR